MKIATGLDRLENQLVKLTEQRDTFLRKLRGKHVECVSAIDKIIGGTQIRTVTTARNKSHKMTVKRGALKKAIIQALNDSGSTPLKVTEIFNRVSKKPDLKGNVTPKSVGASTYQLAIHEKRTGVRRVGKGQFTYTAPQVS